MKFDYNAQPKEEVTSCNLCGSEDLSTTTDHDRYGFAVWVGRCHSCQLGFLNPRMTRDAYRDFYANGTYRELLSEFYGKPITAESIEDQQWGYARVLEKFLEPHCLARRVGTVLDVGGSTGVVGQLFRDKWGCDVTVLEPSEAEAKRAKDRGLTVLLGTIEDLEPDGRRFDLVLLCQTMDHLLDISGSLRTLRALLEDDGLFFADIVNGGHVKIDHPYRLTKATASDFLRRAGFGVMECVPNADGRHIDFVCARA